MSALHVDGLPVAYFDRSVNGETERIAYVTFVWCGDDYVALVRHAYDTVEKIEQMSYANGSGERPVIFWRRRIACEWHEELSQGAENAAPCKVSFRIAAVPQLTEEQWSSLGQKREGELAKML